MCKILVEDCNQEGREQLAGVIHAGANMRKILVENCNKKTSSSSFRFRSS